MSNSSPQIPSLMRAILAEPVGDADILQLKEVEVPVLRDGEVLIKIAAAGINRPDILQRIGKYEAPEGVTDIMGLECAGEIVALGKDTNHYKIGDKVCALISGGGYAEYVNVAEGQCLPIPAGLDMVQAAALPESVFTVWSNLFEIGRLKKGDIALVHGGSSGIGTYAIQMAVAAEAQIIVTVGSQEKADACVKLGAALAINYKQEDFVKKAMEFTNDKGVNVVLDMIGADYVPRNIVAMAYRARHISIATQHGPMAALNMRDIMNYRLTLCGSTMRNRPTLEKTRLAAEVETHVWPWIVAGKVKPVIYQSFPLEKVSQAHKVMESSVHIGKIVLTM